MNVSVIIPTYNRTDSLIDAINSVIHQTIKPKEIIVVDDASEINVLDKLKQTFDFEKHNLIFFRFNKSLGACAARNKGAEVSTSEIIMFLDDDDTWEKTKIQDQLIILERNPDVGLVYSGRSVVLDVNRENIIYKIQPSAEGNLFPEILYKNLIGQTSTVALRRKLFFDIGCFDIDFPAMQDYDLWIRCCKKTLVRHDGKYNVRYTISSNPGKQISGKSERYVEATKRIFEKYSADILKQGYWGKRKIKASFYFNIAKTKKRTSNILGIYWGLKSLLTYPNARSLTLFFPQKLLRFVRGIL